MKILLNEAQEIKLYEAILYEYAGYVSGFEKTINYLYQLIEKTVTYLSKNSMQKEMLNKYKGKNNIDNAVKPIIINESILNKLGIKNVKQLTIHYYISDDESDGGFDKNATTLDNDGKFNDISIYLNINKLIESNMTTLKETLQHELTHAYQMLRMYRNKGEESTNNTFNNRYYTTDIEQNNIPQIFSYLFSKIEMNAFISELYTQFVNNNSDKNNYLEVIEQSNIYSIYLMLMKITKSLMGKNAMKHTENVMKWIDENQEHVDMFPSKNNMTTERYNKRLINMCNDKLKYINDKIRKLTERYLMNKQNNNGAVSN